MTKREKVRMIKTRLCYGFRIHRHSQHAAVLMVCMIAADLRGSRGRKTVNFTYALSSRLCPIWNTIHIRRLSAFSASFQKDSIAEFIVFQQEHLTEMRMHFLAAHQKRPGTGQDDMQMIAVPQVRAIGNAGVAFLHTAGDKTQIALPDFNPYLDPVSDAPEEKSEQEILEEMKKLGM